MRSWTFLLRLWDYLDYFLYLYVIGGLVVVGSGVDLDDWKFSGMIVREMMVWVWDVLVVVRGLFVLGLTVLFISVIFLFFDMFITLLFILLILVNIFILVWVNNRIKNFYGLLFFLWTFWLLDLIFINLWLWGLFDKIERRWWCRRFYLFLFIQCQCRWFSLMIRICSRKYEIVLLLTELVFVVKGGLLFFVTCATIIFIITFIVNFIIKTITITITDRKMQIIEWISMRSIKAL